jgi:hypothetical protein
MRALARNSVLDERELVQAAQEELHPGERARLDREKRGELTDRILAMGTTWVSPSQHPDAPVG